MEGAAGVGVSPGPTHWNTGLPLTVPGRVTEQVRETDSPAVGEEVEGEREIIRGSAGRQHTVNCGTRLYHSHTPMDTTVVLQCGWHTLCGPVHIVCTYSDGLWASHSTGQRVGGGHYGNGVGGPFNQSTDGGRGVTGHSTH